jgi:hypothetical protein
MRCLLNPPRRHTSQAATPIIVYSAVQTGPKSQLGGVQDGFCRLAYHSPGTKTAPGTAALQQSAIHPARTITDMNNPEGHPPMAGQLALPAACGEACIT